MTQPPKKSLSHKQLAYLADRRRWTEIRRLAWKTMPEKMEAIRVRATVRAAQMKTMKNESIRQVMAYWPASLTTCELREYIRQDIDYRGKTTSLIYRLRRNSLVEFKTDGLWHNLARLP